MLNIIRVAAGLCLWDAERIPPPRCEISAVSGASAPNTPADDSHSCEAQQDRGKSFSAKSLQECAER